MAKDFGVLIVGGQKEGLGRLLTDALESRTEALKEAGEKLDFPETLSAGGLTSYARTVAVVFGDGRPLSAADKASVKACMNGGVPIFPVVKDLKKFGTLVLDDELKTLNGFEMPDSDHIEELAGLVLEALGLQRSKRKIFISYVRRESEKVAQQLHDAFMGRWYTVFLDTLSIRPGAIFQDELMQELSDSDVLLLLNSRSVRDRPYVMKEIAFADQAGIGGVQLLWPQVDPMPQAAFFMPVDLQYAPLVNRGANDEKGFPRIDSLTDAGIAEVLATVASVRTEIQRSRENEFLESVKAATKADWNATLHMGRYLALQNKTASGRNAYLDLTLGVPTSHDMERALNRPVSWDNKARMVYDPHGITNRQASHLDFLRSKVGLTMLDHRHPEQWTPL